MNLFRIARAFSKKIEKELLSNPEFDKIFPEFLQHKPHTTILKSAKEYPFMESLKYYKESSEQHPTFADASDHNFKAFVEGFQSPRGPMKDLSAEQLKSINIQIDAKLLELENTGLSREELLTQGRQGGIPLSQDQFFQYIKNNYKARQVYLSPNEEYTVQKVIDLALRQDIGSDQFNAQSGGYENAMKLKRHRSQNDVFVNSKNPLENVNELVKDEVIYHQKPVNKSRKLKQRLRRVNNYDIHWRNTEFLAQFLNSSGKIRSRFQTSLSIPQQKKMARQIDIARHMMLIPIASIIQPFHRRSLTTLQKDIDDFSRKKVNIRTGAVYTETQQQRLERSVEMLAFQDDYEMQQGINRPSGADKDLLQAQLYAETIKKTQLDEQGIVVNPEGRSAQNLTMPNGDVNFRAIRDEELLKQEIKNEDPSKDYKEQYQKVEAAVKLIPGYHISEAIISENAFKFQRLHELGQVNKQTDKTMSKNDSLSVINAVRKRGGLSELQV